MKTSLLRWRLWYLTGLATVSLTAAADQIIYNDALQNGWQNYSWATVNLANTSPVHSGTDSISVTCSAWSALYFWNTAFNPSPYTNLSFWINGGASGGHYVQVQAVNSGGSAVASGLQLGPLTANSWVHVNASLSVLLPSGTTSINGFWIQESKGNSLPTFYVDDVTLQTGTQPPPPPPPTNQPVSITVDAGLDHHSISPYVYGVAFATSNQLSDLNVTLHRSGGNSTTRYNWQLNATSLASDWYFESTIGNSTNVAGDYDDFVRASKNGGAQAMLTIPIMGWVATLGANKTHLDSFSVAKYGAQSATDPYWSDAGNGVSSGNGLDITNNNPADANIAVGTNFQVGLIQHLTNTWHTATNGGLQFYIMDNEWSIWFQTHRDVHPIGPTMDEVLGRFTTNSLMVKNVDPNAFVCGPEEWGWDGYFYSGYDQQYTSLHGYSTYPDRNAHGGQDFCPWFLSQLKQESQTAGKRLIDYFTLHCYPQGGEALNEDISTATEVLRNQSTRSLWDTNYVDQSWINSVVMLIPRMKNWVTNYPGTKIGITEYNWGADDYMNGATAQADVLGIFGREGLDLASRWTVPDTGTPAYNAFKLYRNYDGKNSVFGDQNTRCTVPNPDELSAFSAVRTSDGALTIMVINKDLTNVTPAVISVTNFTGKSTAQVWQMSAANTNAILQLPNATITSSVISNSLPPQSITLFVVAPNTNNAPSLHFSGTNLWLNAAGGSTCILQASTNLLHWTNLSTNQLSSNSIALPVSFPGTRQQFFRALVTP
jgi:alpha-L-arabinofuranosidase